MKTHLFLLLNYLKYHLKSHFDMQGKKKKKKNDFFQKNSFFQSYSYKSVLFIYNLLIYIMLDGKNLVGRCRTL